MGCKSLQDPLNAASDAAAPAAANEACQEHPCLLTPEGSGQDAAACLSDEPSCATTLGLAAPVARLDVASPTAAEAPVEVSSQDAADAPAPAQGAVKAGAQLLSSIDLLMKTDLSLVPQVRLLGGGGVSSCQPCSSPASSSSSMEAACLEAVLVLGVAGMQPSPVSTLPHPLPCRPLPAATGAGPEARAAVHTEHHDAWRAAGAGGSRAGAPAGLPFRLPGASFRADWRGVGCHGRVGALRSHTHQLLRPLPDSSSAAVALLAVYLLFQTSSC